jgi:hypothetical protein
MKTHENPNRQPTRVKAIALPAAAEANMLQHETREKPARGQPPPQRRHYLLLLAASVVVVGFVGVLVWDFTLQNEEVPGCEHTAVLGITIFIQSMIAFFGILNLEEPHSSRVSPVTKGGMRCAIAAAFVVTYVFLVIFHTMVDFAAGQPLTTSTKPTTDQFVNSFTGIVGLTIGFYFASEAAIHAVNVLKGRENIHRILEKPTLYAQHSRPNGSASEI